MAEDRRDTEKARTQTNTGGKAPQDARKAQGKQGGGAPTSPPSTMPDAPEIAEGMRNPAGTPGMGKRTAEGVAAPHQREAVEGRDKVVGGFTTSALSGSEGGRSMHGTETEDEDDSV